MDIKELRIGNYVMGNKPFQLDLNTFNMMWNHWNLKKELRFEPITLTEQWLIDFGFELLEQKVYTKQITNFINIYITIEYGASCYIGYSEADNCDLDLRDIYSVHQLQNLYFVLTNKELELNVKKC